MLALKHPPAGHPRFRFTIAVVPGLVTLLVVAAALFISQRLLESRRLVEHSHNVIDVTQRLFLGMLNAETGVRAYVLVGDPQFLEPYVGSDSAVHNRLQQLRQLTRDNASQQRRLAAITTLVDERFAAFRQMIAERQSGNGAAAVAVMPEGKLRMDQIRTLLAGFRGEERYLLKVRDQQDLLNQWIAACVIGIGGLIAILVSLLANRLLLRHAADLAEANTELLAQAHQLEEQALELESQAAELEATAAELEATNMELEEQAVELEEQRDTAQSSRAEAEQANAAKSRFLSVMSHELRTPLNAIAGYIDLMAANVHGPVTDEQHEDIRRIKRAVGQLTSIINDILNFAKLEAGEVRFDIGAMPLQEALANATALIEPQAATKGIRFLSAPCDPDIVAQADRERVQQVVLNLLTNAVKYTQEGGEVRIDCVQQGRTVHIRVSDTGRGIAADDVHRIFDPFVQLPGAAHTPSEGVGLGLAISRDLARGMGGDITVSSRTGEGSVFEFTLPVWRREERSVATALNTHARAARSDLASRTESR